MEITKATKVSEILREFGDIADVMEMFGIKRVSGYTVRKFLTKALTVERAARIHRVPLDEFLTALHTAVGLAPDRLLVLPDSEGTHEGLLHQHEDDGRRDHRDDGGQHQRSVDE